MYETRKYFIYDTNDKIILNSFALKNIFKESIAYGIFEIYKISLKILHEEDH